MTEEVPLLTGVHKLLLAAVLEVSSKADAGFNGDWHTVGSKSDFGSIIMTRKPF